MPATAHCTEPSLPDAAAAYWQAFWKALLTMAAVAMTLLLASLANNQENRRQRDTLHAKAVQAIIDDPTTQTNVYDPQLLAMIVNDPLAAENATTLVFRDVDFSSGDYDRAAELKHVRRLGFYSCEGIETVLARLQGTPSIERVFFENTAITDNGIRMLSTLPRLRQVHLEQVVSRRHIALLQHLLRGVYVRIPYPEPDHLEH